MPAAESLAPLSAGILVVAFHPQSISDCCCSKPSGSWIPAVTAVVTVAGSWRPAVLTSAGHSMVPSNEKDMQTREL